MSFVFRSGIRALVFGHVVYVRELFMDVDRSFNPGPIVQNGEWLVAHGVYWNFIRFKIVMEWYRSSMNFLLLWFPPKSHVCCHTHPSFNQWHRFQL